MTIAENVRTYLRRVTPAIYDLALHTHAKIYQATKGAIGHKVPGSPPILLLHTVGARTGKRRTATLSYSRDGNDYVIVASDRGAPKSPGWYHNLKANPNIEINVGPKRFRVEACPVLPDSSDYARLWKVINEFENDRNLINEYQKRTSRPFPIVVLVPQA